MEGLEKMVLGFGIIMFAFLTFAIYSQNIIISLNIENFCKEQGFQEMEYFKGNYHCLRVESKTVVETQKIRCKNDLVKGFSSTPINCKIWKVAE